MAKTRLPDWSEQLFYPKRYKCLYGGRGSAKSHTAAEALLIIGRRSPKRILCGREFQNSIAESVHKLLENKIEKLGWQSFYKVYKNAIIGRNGTQFFFKGVKTNVYSIKSMEDIDILWLEEGQTISKESWDILVPTIRKPGSEIWVTFNPENDDDPTYTRFIKVDESGNHSPVNNDHVFTAKINWRENPWFPEELKKEKDWMAETDPDLYEHIWEGGCKINSDAQIFNKKWAIREFEVEEHWHGPYYGADFGFSQDPSTLVKIYVDPLNMNLMIYQEAWGIGVELDDLPALYDTIKGSRHETIRGDCSRPETINHLQKRGFIITGAKKWDGSVQDGIEFIRSFKKVIIHPRCPRTAIEFKKYSFKVDKLTGDVTSLIVDEWNHIIDAIRYALEPMIGDGGLSILDVLGNIRR
jgi:phage terminase large subunit